MISTIFFRTSRRLVSFWWSFFQYSSHVYQSCHVNWLLFSKLYSNENFTFWKINCCQYQRPYFNGYFCRIPSWLYNNSHIRLWNCTLFNLFCIIFSTISRIERLTNSFTPRWHNIISSSRWYFSIRRQKTLRS